MFEIQKERQITPIPQSPLCIKLRAWRAVYTHLRGGLKRSTSINLWSLS
jgi:hypothetical protein